MKIQHTILSRTPQEFPPLDQSWFQTFQQKGLQMVTVDLRPLTDCTYLDRFLDVDELNTILVNKNHFFAIITCILLKFVPKPAGLDSRQSRWRVKI